MAFFSRTAKTGGCIAVRLHGDGISAACVDRPPAAPPKVSLAAFYPAQEADWEAGLQKLAKAAKAARPQCSTLMRKAEYQFLSVDAPNVPRDELKAAIRWRLKDMLDFHVDDATIDVLDVPADRSAAGRSHSMYAVAARNQIIEQRQKLFAGAKIPLSVIDIPEMAQRNISALFEPPGQGLAMLSFDAEGGLFTVTSDGELYLSRRVDVTLEQLTQPDEEQQRAWHDRITLEVQRSLDHFDRYYHFIPVPKLILAPLPAQAQSLQAYLAANLYIGIETVDLRTVLDLSGAPELHSADAQQRYFLTLGAALRQEEMAL